MMIRTIIFDFGGVLFKPPDAQFMNRWKKRINFSENPAMSEAFSMSDESPFMQRIFLGEVPEDQVWRQMEERTEVPSVVFRWTRRWLESKRRLNRPMIRLLRGLQADYQTAILSNAGDQARNWMTEILELDRYVEAIIISAEEGLIKPSREIYEVALDRLHAQAQTTLFVDDRMENVLAARDLGMQAVQFTTNEQTISAIQGILGKAG